MEQAPDGKIEITLPDGTSVKLGDAAAGCSECDAIRRILIPYPTARVTKCNRRGLTSVALEPAETSATVYELSLKSIGPSGPQQAFA